MYNDKGHFSGVFFFLNNGPFHHKEWLNRSKGNKPGDAQSIRLLWDAK